MTKLEDWTWDEPILTEVQERLEEYIYLLHDKVELGEDPNTASGWDFDGCSACEARESMAFLMPRFLDLYIAGHIRLQHTNNGD